MLVLALVALAADATGVRFESAEPGSALSVPPLALNPGNFDASVVGTLVGTSAVAYYSDGTREVLLSETAVVDLALAWNADRRWRVEAGLPVVAGASVGESLGGVGGDLWVAASYAALSAGSWRLGPRARLSTPVSPYGPLTTEGGLAGVASLVAQGGLSTLAVSAEVGLGGRPEYALGAEGELTEATAGGLVVPAGVALRHPLFGPLAVGAELALSLDPATASTSGAPVEGVGGELLAHLDLDLRRVDLVAGGGLGLGAGLGVPESRVFVGLRGHVVAGPQGPADADSDGVVDVSDTCPSVPEDRDGFRDQDGCPDDDDDKDGLADAADKCPHDPEDRDNFEDGDGCPDPDNDGDGINDGADDCPLRPGTAAARGCPEAPGRVRVTAARIEIDDRVYFDTGRATIQEVSFPLLREVAAAINASPDIRRVQVAGHTDSEGDDAANLALSQARADAVRLFLVTYGGVEPGRLEARGFGETMPVATNSTEEGRAQNRRVEFVIVHRR